MTSGFNAPSGDRAAASIAQNAASVPLSAVHRWLRPPIHVTRKQRALALAIAGIADLLQLVLFPVFAEGAFSPFDDALDVVVVIALTLILGFRWRLAIALALELVPGLSLCPSWSLVVLSLPIVDARKPVDAVVISSTPIEPEPLSILPVAVDAKEADKPR
jgi:hypothetical protein